MFKLFFGSIFIGFVGGVVYAVAIHFSPFILLNFVIFSFTVGFLGSGVWRLARWGRVPSQLVIGVASLLAAFAAVYASWGTSFALNARLLALFCYSPFSILYFALLLFEESSISLELLQQNIEIKGAMLALVWLAELLAFCAGVIYFATKQRRLGGPFCELCHTWYDVERGFLRLDAADAEHMLDSIEQGDFLWLVKSPFASVDDDPHVRIDVAGCKSCVGQRTASIWLVRYAGETERLLEDETIPNEVARALETRREMYLDFAEEEESEDDELDGGGD